MFTIGIRFSIRELAVARWDHRRTGQIALTAGGAVGYGIT
jgi:hypothetical protein